MKKNEEQSRAEQSRAEQSRAEQSRAEQSRACLKALLLGLFLLVSAMPQTAWGEVKLEQVLDDWDFGTYLYNGTAQEDSKAPIGLGYGDYWTGGDGDKKHGIRWKDTEISTNGRLDIFMTIKSLTPSDPALEKGKLKIWFGKSAATSAGAPNHREPEERFDAGEDSRWSINDLQWTQSDAPYKGVEYPIPFNGQRVWVTGEYYKNAPQNAAQIPNARRTYEEWRAKGYSFYMPVNAVRVSLPAGCKLGKKTLEITWDISVTPE